jgi:hypothetical protein
MHAAYTFVRHLIPLPDFVRGREVEWSAVVVWGAFSFVSKQAIEESGMLECTFRYASTYLDFPALLRSNYVV